MKSKFEKCKSCTDNKSRSLECKECDGDNNYNELYEADPNSRHMIILSGGGGIRCAKCKGWFCF